MAGAATVTLSATTLKTTCAAGDTAVQLASTTGLTVNNVTTLRLWIDRELLTVISLGLGTWVNVLRGSDGSIASAHGSSAVVYIGRADQFYAADPIGLPPSPVLVSPWINVLTGTMWLAEGDELGPSAGARFWQAVTNVPGTGALGVRTTTQNPTS